MPVGLSLADHLLSCHLAQGVVALLVRRARTGRGGLVETSLLEGMLDLQLVGLTERLSAGSPVGDPTAEPGGGAPATGLRPVRDRRTAGSPLSASRERLVRLLGGSAADEDGLRARSCAAARTDAWLELMDAPEVWCSPVLTLEELLEHDAYAAVAMTQTVEREPREPGGAPVRIRTTRSPIRIDGERLLSGRGSPRLGAQGRVGASTVLTDDEPGRRER